MSSLHNDLDSWAAKARSRGSDRIEITNETAERIGQTLRDHQRLLEEKQSLFKVSFSHNKEGKLKAPIWWEERGVHMGLVVSPRTLAIEAYQEGVEEAARSVFDVLTYESSRRDKIA